MNNIDQLVAPEGSGRLESLKQRFTEWLQSVHSGKRKVPEELWPAAVALGRVYSVSRNRVKELGLDYGNANNIFRPPSFVANKRTAF